MSRLEARKVALAPAAQCLVATVFRLVLSASAMGPTASFKSCQPDWYIALSGIACGSIGALLGRRWKDFGFSEGGNPDRRRPSTRSVCGHELGDSRSVRGAAEARPALVGVCPRRAARQGGGETRPAGAWLPWTLRGGGRCRSSPSRLWPARVREGPPSRVQREAQAPPAGWRGSAPRRPRLASPAPAGSPTWHALRCCGLIAPREQHRAPVQRKARVRHGCQRCWCRLPARRWTVTSQEPVLTLQPSGRLVGHPRVAPDRLDLNQVQRRPMA